MWILLESATPSDMESIEASFNKDVSDDKFLPTKEFLKNAYCKLNSELFDDELPTDIKLNILNGDSLSKVASANCNLVIDDGFVYSKDYEISLNSKFKLTIHTWIEIVAHEMIHILDYMKYPKHYLDDEYDEHGDWFFSVADGFADLGIDIKSELDYETDNIDLDDDEVLNIMGNEMYLGYKTGGIIEFFKILKSDKDDWIKIIRQNNDDNLIDRISIFKTENPNSVKIPPLEFKGEDSELVFYKVTNRFNDKYGPFEEDGELNLTEIENESDSDEILRILNSKKNVTARKIGKNTYRISIS